MSVMAWIVVVVAISIGIGGLIGVGYVMKDIFFGDDKPSCESPIEWRLYNALVRKGYYVRTQVWCGCYRIDLVLPYYRIAIECDGFAFHSSPSQKRYDKKRTSFLYRQGWRSVLRFKGHEINQNVDACVERIEKKIKESVK